MLCFNLGIKPGCRNVSRSWRKSMEVLNWEKSLLIW